MLSNKVNKLKKEKKKDEEEKRMATSEEKKYVLVCVCCWWSCDSFFLFMGGGGMVTRLTLRVVCFIVVRRQVYGQLVDALAQHANELVTFVFAELRVSLPSSIEVLLLEPKHT